MFRGDAAHTGVYASEGPRAFHGVKWKFATGGKVISSPVWRDGAVYFGSDDGNLYSLDATTGRQNWQFTTSGPVASTPAVEGGVIYFGSYDGKFYAVDAKSGALKWKFATAGERRFTAPGIHGVGPRTELMPDPFDVFLSSPVVVGETVFFGSGDHRVLRQRIGPPVHEFRPEPKACSVHGQHAPGPASDFEGLECRDGQCPQDLQL